MQERVRSALAWLVRSQDATGCGGSAAYYAPVWGWGPAYPETSGYIVPTLWRGADALGLPEHAGRAERMARWLLTLQAEEGWFPGGTCKPGRRPEPSVFNTGQILFGLLAAAERTGDEAFRCAAEKAVTWLRQAQDADGRWTRGAYVPGYSPSYYAHVCWPLAEYWARYGGDEVRACIDKALQAILAERTPEGTFRTWGFAPGKPAFTHTIGYTLQGLLETARLTGTWEPAGEAAADSCARLLRKAEIAAGLAGAYDVGWRPTSWFICLTGHCQVASAWMRVYERSGDPRFLSAALKALEEVCRRQCLAPHAPNRHGAIAGSYPPYGRYMRFRYPNWAAKFFVDAMLEAGAHLRRLQGRGKAEEAACHVA
jgi:hypothetical protein